MLLILDENMTCIDQCRQLEHAPEFIRNYLILDGSMFEDDKPITDEDHILFRPYEKDAPKGLPKTDGFRLAVYVMRNAKVNDTRLSVIQVG